MQSSSSHPTSAADPLRPEAEVEVEGTIDTNDSEALIARGGQAIEAAGNDLGRAASGEFQDVDLETARQRMRDCQGALVGMGYSLGDHDDPADAVHGMADDATAAAVMQFQEDNDLDATGIINRDTYEALLRSFEQAMSMRENMQVEDDFMPVHASESLQDTVDATDAVDSDVEPLDDSEEMLLSLRDEMREGGSDPLAEDL